VSSLLVPPLFVTTKPDFKMCFGFFFVFRRWPTSEVLCPHPTAVFFIFAPNVPPVSGGPPPPIRQQPTFIQLVFHFQWPTTLCRHLPFFYHLMVVKNPVPTLDIVKNAKKPWPEKRKQSFQNCPHERLRNDLENYYLEIPFVSAFFKNHVIAPPPFCEPFRVRMSFGGAKARAIFFWRPCGPRAPPAPLMWKTHVPILTKIHLAFCFDQWGFKFLGCLKKCGPDYTFFFGANFC